MNSVAQRLPVSDFTTVSEKSESAEDKDEVH